MKWTYFPLLLPLITLVLLTVKGGLMGKSAFSQLHSGNEATAPQLWGQRQPLGRHPSAPRINKETSLSSVNRKKPGFVPPPGSNKVVLPPYLNRTMSQKVR